MVQFWYSHGHCRHFQTTFFTTKKKTTLWIVKLWSLMSFKMTSFLWQNTASHVCMKKANKDKSLSHKLNCLHTAVEKEPWWSYNGTSASPQCACMRGVGYFRQITTTKSGTIVKDTFTRDGPIFNCFLKKLLWTSVVDVMKRNVFTSLLFQL